MLLLHYNFVEFNMEQISQFINNHWPLCAAFIAILALIYVNEWVSQKRSAKSLSPQAAVEKINHESAVVIDLRDQEAFNGGHVINAIRAAASDFDLPRMNKYKEKSIILVCSRGLQSQSLAPKLKSNGFTNAMILDGGITAWQTAGLPLVKGTK